jgi:hypothetical protein
MTSNNVGIKIFCSCWEKATKFAYEVRSWPKFWETCVLQNKKGDFQRRWRNDALMPNQEGQHPMQSCHMLLESWSFTSLEL